MSEVDMGRTIVLGCEHSAGEALQTLKARDRSMPEHIEWVELSCGGGLDELHLLRAFEDGADRVLVLTCQDGACHSMDGSEWAGRRVRAVRALLKEAGLDGDRLEWHQMAPTMAADLWGWLTDGAAPNKDD
jgi:coenzyme F420-reducing hydrogenase delta subunit